MPDDSPSSKPRHADSIRWPAILHYAGSAELCLIRSAAEWAADAQLHGAHYHPEDRLIDVAGRSYSLQQRDSEGIAPAFDGRTLTLQEILPLIRHHAAEDGACCVAKLSAESIAEAFRLLE